MTTDDQDHDKAPTLLDKATEPSPSDVLVANIASEVILDKLAKLRQIEEIVRGDSNCHSWSRGREVCVDCEEDASRFWSIKAVLDGA